MSEQTFKRKADVLRRLLQEGWQVKQATFYYHVNEGKLKPDKDGSFNLKAVEKYAKAHLLRAGEGPKERPEAGAQEKRAEAQAKEKEVDAKIKAITLAKLEGKTLEKAVVEDELAVRARAFRVGLEGFMTQAAAGVLEAMGGGEAQARRLIELCQGDEARLMDVQAHFQGLAPELVQRWGEMVEKFLAPYATGAWWTEDMAQAMADQGVVVDEGGEAA